LPRLRAVLQAAITALWGPFRLSPGRRQAIAWSRRRPRSAHGASSDGSTFAGPGTHPPV